jgi:hypothetical protein
MTTCEAQVIDSTHLELTEMLLIPPGSKVRISIQPVDGKEIADEPGWYLVAAQGLEAAYGENEPDYSTEQIKVFNPDYQP